MKPIHHTLLALALGLAGCGGGSRAASDTAASDESASASTSGSETTATPDDTSGSDIVDTAVSAGSFSTLVAAVQAAGLEDTLRGPGPFTVFAPTDDAFAALPEGTVENLLRPENQERLRAILTYHVVSGDVRADQVTSMTEAATVEGDPIAISVEDGTVTLDGSAHVTQADIACSNGVIHVIDAVLMPPG